MLGRPPASLRERFDAKWMPEPNSGCWLWLAATKRRGYGTISLGSAGDGESAAHRVSWELYRGPIPTGLWVLHKCDVPSCVNPAHLFLGTSNDNVADMLAKGRARPPRGDRHWTTHLTDSDVVAIRNAPPPYREIAERFGVSESTVADIRNLKRWRHI